MRSLVVDDDCTNRLLLQTILDSFGPVSVSRNGREAADAVTAALVAGEPYDLICLDIMMPDMDGQEALKEIRSVEGKFGRVGMQGGELVTSRRVHGKRRSVDGSDSGESMPGARILMVSAVHDGPEVERAYRAECDGFLVKPIEKAKLLEYLRVLELLECEAG